MSEDFDRLINQKEMSHEKQIEQLTRLRKELEAKIETSDKEMAILKTLIAEQKQQLIESYMEREAEMAEKMSELRQSEIQIENLKIELQNLKKEGNQTNTKYYEELQVEIKNLKESLNANKTLVVEQVAELTNKQATIDTLNSQIMDLYKTMEENANKVLEKDDEIAYMQEILDSNKNEMEKLVKDSDENKKVVEKLLIELHSHKEKQSELQRLSAVNEDNRKLEERVKELDNLHNLAQLKNKEQLEKLKKFAANLKKKSAHCIELENQLKAIEKEPTVVKKIAVVEVESNITQVDEEKSVLQAQAVRYEQQLRDLRANINILQDQANEHRSILQAETGRFEHQLYHLTNTKESLLLEKASLLEKCKKLETDLQKTRTVSNELNSEITNLRQSKFNSDEIFRKLNFGLDELQQKIDVCTNEIKEKDSKLEENAEDIKMKNVKFEKCKAVIKEKNREIQRLTKENQSLTAQLSQQHEEISIPVQLESSNFESQYNELKSNHNQLLEVYENEKITFQDTIARLEMLHDGIQAKLQEDMSYIESLEFENNKYKEKICKLEDCVASFEERRSSMERRANLLDAQLQSKTDEFEKNEDALVYRLNMLSDHDDVIGQRLLECQEEKEDLAEKLDKLKQEHSECMMKYTKLEKDFVAFQLDTSTTLETENQSLRDQLATIETDINKIHGNYNAKLAKKHAEIDELENDLSDQLQKIENDKRQLKESMERALDEINELKDENVKLKENLNSTEQARNELDREITWIKMQNDNLSQDQFELQELRMQVLQDKTENENLKHQIETLSQNHDIELNALKLQISELDTLRMQVGQNQTDDQVFIETENKRLKDLLAEKESVIENYQRQNLQLQMSSLMMPSPSGAQTTDPFSGFASSSQPDDSVEINSLRAKIDILEKEICESQVAMQLKCQENTRLVQELNILQVELHAIQSVNPKSNDDINILKEKANQFQLEITELQNLLQVKNQENINLSEDLNNAQSKLQALELVSLQIEKSDLLDRQIKEMQADIARKNEETEKERCLNQQNIEHLEKQLNELTATLKEKVGQNERLSIDLGAIQIEFQKILLNCSEISEHNQLKEQKIISLENELKKLHESPIHNIASVFPVESDGGTVFDEIVNVRHVENVSAGVPNTSQIETLQKSVSDLKKYTAELENKLKVLQQQLDESKNAFENKSKELKYFQANAQDIQIQKNVESLIIPHAETVISNTVPSLNMFFNESSHSASQFEEIIIPTIQSDYPVIAAEETIVPKKAYICHPDAQTTSLDVGGDWDDSWGAEDAALEEKHFEMHSIAPTTLVPLTQQLEIKLQEAQDQIQELQLERDRLEEQKQELQVKSGKLMKKLKDYKVKIDDFNSQSHFRKSSSIESNDLDLAIQEELKSQVKQLEEKVVEMKKQIEKDTIEKGGLTKRIDVLSSANDRMTEMKERQDSDVQMYQSRIRELSQKLKNLEDWDGDHVEPNKEETDTTRAQIELQRQIDELTNELNDTKVDRDELQALFDEEKINIQRADSKIKSLLERISTLEEYQSRETSENKSELNEIKLENKNLALELSKLNDIAKETQAIGVNFERLKVEHNHKLEENSKLKLDVENLTIQNRDLTTEIEALRLEISPNIKREELEEKLQEKDSEILHLKNKIEDLRHEDQTEKLVLEILTKNQEIHMLKMQVKHLEEEKTDLENNLSLQITRDMEHNKVNAAAPSEHFQAQISQLEKTISDLRTEKINMEEELQVLNNHVMNSLENEDKTKQIILELDMKSIEIAELKKSLEIAREHQGATLQPTSGFNLEQVNAQWETIVEQKCSEIAESWRNHLANRESEFKEIEKKFQNELETIEQRNENQIPAATTFESSGDSSESADSELIQKMQIALESQELEIVTLKEQLAIRSAEYARIAAQFDPYQLKTGSSTSMDQHRRSISAGDNTVPKTELDLALYMLHQRDMKCEELTLELVNLLEERDTLQLKLSNSIRQVEEIKRKTELNEALALDSTIGSTETPEKSTILPEHIETSSEELRAKLSQLHSMNFSRDKNFQEDRQQRIRQMEKIQKDVANIPQQAVSELVGSDISQTNESPSMVLLNWLWGKPPSNSQQQS